ncbi:ABC transporter ATP-binding protein [Microbispora sp. NPDC088329]|uniref:ABC transporter ATP-binding protein n=1 Tax=Microbispora sp. NPDC088329 TaxID=3154869 RepID=UPI00342D644F
MRWSNADRQLARMVRVGLGWNILLLATNLASAVGALLFPALLAAAIDERLGGAGHDALLRLAALIAALVAAEIAEQMIAPWCVSTLTLGLRRDLLSRALRLKPRDRTAFSPGDLTSRLLTNTTETAAVVPLLSGSVTSLLVSGGALVALAIIDIRLALAFAAGLPAAMMVTRTFVGRVTPLLNSYMKIQGRIAGRLVEVLAGIRTVRAAGTERHEIDRILADLPDLHRAGRESWRLQGTLNLRAGLLMPLMQVAVIATAGYTLMDGAITPGEMTAAVGYTGMAMGLFSQANIFMALAQARAGARRVQEVLDLEATPHGDRELPEGNGAVSLRQVTVAGPDGPVLDRVDLHVPGGSVIAVVGRSGSGKSTLAAVAGRLTDPDDGDVLLDGVPIAALTPAALAAAVGWAFERPAYLTGTLGEAIGLGAPEGASDGRIRRAAAAAQADEFIRRFPRGYDTPCSEAPLSGGERQRLGLARGMAHGGRLLILDDALSSVDSVTELYIADALADGDTAGTTRIVTTHRISVAARADRVVWLENGRVRAYAPHDDLWSSPDYRSLFTPGEQDRPDVRQELSHA